MKENLIKYLEKKILNYIGECSNDRAKYIEVILMINWWKERKKVKYTDKED